MKTMAFPFHLDASGRTAMVGGDARVRQMIEQVLFTAPGERVNREGFGSGLRNLVFASGGPEVVAATQMQVQGALQQQLDTLILIEGVTVTVSDDMLNVEVRYALRATGAQRSARFARGVTL